MKHVEKRDHDKEFSNHIGRLTRREILAEHSLHGRKHSFHTPAFSISSSLLSALILHFFSLAMREKE